MTENRPYAHLCGPVPPSLEPGRFSCAIFDFDGTLADSLGIWKQVDDLFFEKRGLTYRPGYAEKLSTLGFEDGARFTIETYGLTDSVQDICDEWNAMGRELYRAQVHLRPGAADYVHTLRSRGVATSIATTNAPEVLDAMSERDLIHALFPVRVHGAQVPHHTKDHPDIYQEALRQMGGAAQDCIVFEDLPAGITTAKALGMTTVAVLSPTTHPEMARRLVETADYAIDTWGPVAEKYGRR